MLPTVIKSIGAYRFYERWLEDDVTSKEMPEHVGIILDGNRRWGFEKYGERLDGHIYGAKTGEDFLEWCLELRIKTVTLYVFSTENFGRTQHETSKILKLIEDETRKLITDRRIHESRVHVKALGRLELLPGSLRDALAEIERVTAGYDQHYLNIAVAYGGRAEIIDAAKRMIDEVKSGLLDEGLVDEDTFRKYLYTSHLPNPYPELIIRTSGEARLSGFLLWQAAYSEFVFLDVYWPEFRKIDLLRAIRTYQRRKRRFGK
ncbi:MAG TPA: polyprenyl diphosphate synthase [Candidatus Dormibacteraeota bacterium]|jgi:tritrans,polycis-undecaprenyl-diphosphate synthase [geranylgeranyl-diphosphate specific]|nr:polyprenyl diphosphate synthase [Candidatus Dormibacteraeota bacterium]